MPTPTRAAFGAASWFLTVALAIGGNQNPDIAPWFYGAALVFFVIGVVLLLPPISERMPGSRREARLREEAVTELAALINEATPLIRGLKALGVTSWDPDWPPDNESSWPHYAEGYMPMVYGWRDKAEALVERHYPGFRAALESDAGLPPPTDYGFPPWRSEAINLLEGRVSRLIRLQEMVASGAIGPASSRSFTRSP